MSAYVRVQDGGQHVTVNCDQCGINDRHAYYRDANAAARTHNLARHPNRIDWAS